MFYEFCEFELIVTISPWHEVVEKWFLKVQLLIYQYMYQPQNTPNRP